MLDEKSGNCGRREAMIKFAIKTALALSLLSIGSLVVFPTYDVSKTAPAYVATTDVPTIAQKLAKNYFKPPSK